MATPDAGVEGCGTQPPEAIVTNPKTSEAIGEQVGCQGWEWPLLGRAGC